MSLNPSLFRSPVGPLIEHSPRSSPIPHFENPPEDEPDEQQQLEDAEEEDEIPYLEPSSEQTLLPPANFRPFFTLIEDTTSGEHHHPYVHYVFADDDLVIVTAASMRSLGLDETRHLPNSTPEDNDKERSHEEEDKDTEDSTVDSPLPPPIPGVTEHYLLIDLGADGRTILDAESLSPIWQITDTSIRTAPSFDESSPDQGYMLRVEGVQVAGKSRGKGKASSGDNKLNDAREKNQGDIFEALDSLVQDVDGGLAMAAKIVGGRSTKGQDTVTDVRVAEDKRTSTAEI